MSARRRLCLACFAGRRGVKHGIAADARRAPPPDNRSVILLEHLSRSKIFGAADRQPRTGRAAAAMTVVALCLMTWPSDDEPWVFTSAPRDQLRPSVAALRGARFPPSTALSPGHAAR